MLLTKEPVLRQTVFACVVLQTLILGSTAGAQEQPAARPCLSKVDDKNFDALVACYYEPGGKFLYPGPFDFLSTESAARLQRGSFPEVATDFTVLSAKPLGSEQVDGRRFSRVSVRHQRGKCEVTVTQTWVAEKGKWRRVWLPLTEQLAQKQDAEGGQVKELIATHNDWLKSDPYALMPIETLVDLLQMGPDLVEAKMLDKLPVSPHGNQQQLVARALKTNPDDDLAMRMGIRFGASVSDARAIFDRVPKNACARRNHVAEMIDRLSEPSEILALVVGEKEESAFSVTTTVLRLVELEAASQLQQYLNPARSAALRQAWEAKGNDKAATHSAMLAVVLAKIPDKVAAKKWKDYSLRVAPGNVTAEVILEGVKW